MKLTKEECLKEIHNLERYIGREFECSQVMRECENSLDVLEQLIDEYFKSLELLRIYKEVYDTAIQEKLELYSQINELKSNEPLKFEELKEGMWVWDNKEKMYGKIAHEPYQRFGLLTVPGYMWGVFEENRFYRREVQDETN